MRTARWTISGLALVLFIFSVGLYSQQPTPELNSLQCKRLYDHKLKILSRTDSLFGPAVSLNQENLKSGPTRLLQLKRCRDITSLKSYDCQLKSNSLLGLLSCEAKFPRSSAVDKKGIVDVKVDRTGKPGVTQQNQRKGGLSVTPKNCARTYGHLLNVYTNSPELAKRSDRDRLLKHWRSETSRKSFLSRCGRVFQPENLSCILSTKDSVVLQGCLLKIPE